MVWVRPWTPVGIHSAPLVAWPGIETSLTWAPSFASSRAASRTFSSTSGSELACPKPSWTTAMRRPSTPPSSSSV